MVSSKLYHECHRGASYTMGGNISSLWTRDLFYAIKIKCFGVNVFNSTGLFGIVLWLEMGRWLHFVWKFLPIIHSRIGSLRFSEVWYVKFNIWSSDSHLRVIVHNSLLSIRWHKQLKWLWKITGAGDEEIIKHDYVDMFPHRPFANMFYAA